MAARSILLTVGDDLVPTLFGFLDADGEPVDLTHHTVCGFGAWRAGRRTRSRPDTKPPGRRKVIRFVAEG
jgi:hypothetical protein